MLASGLFFLVREIDDDGHVEQCVQFGGRNLSNLNCSVLGDWNSDWNSPLNGKYLELVNMESANMSSSVWEVCAGNTCNASDTSGFLYGQLNFTSVISTWVQPSSVPTIAPSRNIVSIFVDNSIDTAPEMSYCALNTISNSSMWSGLCNLRAAFYYCNESAATLCDIFLPTRRIILQDPALGSIFVDATKGLTLHGSECAIKRK
jgi:hypothetical protein